MVQDASAALGVVRWPRGAHSSITMPSYSNCKVGEDDIVATFHTHPNAGAEYLQEPSATDRRAVKDDRDLKGDFYEGEFVLSQATVYLVTPDGKVSELGRMSDFFSGTSDD